jgi:hypothetical protein
LTDTVLNTQSLTETLFRLIPTEKVRLHEKDGEIRLTPVPESPATDNFLSAKHASVEAEEKMYLLNDLCGSCSDLEMTTDSFIAMTHDETEAPL